MAADNKQTSEQRFENFLGNLLRFGALLAAAVVRRRRNAVAGVER